MNDNDYELYSDDDNDINDDNNDDDIDVDIDDLYNDTSIYFIHALSKYVYKKIYIDAKINTMVFIGNSFYQIGKIIEQDYKRIKVLPSLMYFPF